MAAHVEKDRVPKMTSHFESLADKVKNEKEREEETEKQKEQHIDQASKEEGREGGGEGIEVSKGHEKKEQPSLEEISKLRAIAQQNSLETLRAAEERYEKAKEFVSQGLGAATEYAKEKAAQAKDTVLETGQAVKEAAEYAGHKAAEIASKPLSAAKDVAVATRGSGKEYTARKKEETQRELEAKRSAESQGDDIEGESQVQETKAEDDVEKEAKPSDSFIQETFQGTQEHGRGGFRGGVLGAISETIVEIAQQTKELVIGQDKTGKEEGGTYESGLTAYRKQEQHEHEGGGESQNK